MVPGGILQTPRKVGEDFLFSVDDFLASKRESSPFYFELVVELRP
jgi:hypothetical protein